MPETKKPTNIQAVLEQMARNSGKKPEELQKALQGMSQGGTPFEGSNYRPASDEDWNKAVKGGSTVNLPGEIKAGLAAGPIADTRPLTGPASLSDQQPVAAATGTTLPGVPGRSGPVGFQNPGAGLDLSPSPGSMFAKGEMSHPLAGLMTGAQYQGNFPPEVVKTLASRDLANAFPSLDQITQRLATPLPSDYHFLDNGQKLAWQQEAGKSQQAALQEYARSQGGLREFMGEQSRRGLGLAGLGLESEKMRGEQAAKMGSLGLQARGLDLEEQKLGRPYLVGQAAAQRYIQSGQIPPEEAIRALGERMGLATSGQAQGQGTPVGGRVGVGGTAPTPGLPSASTSAGMRVADAVTKGAPYGDKRPPQDQIASVVSQLSDKELRNPEVFNALMAKLRGQYGSQFDEDFSKQTVKPDWVYRLGSGIPGSVAQLRRLESAYKEMGGAERGKQSHLGANVTGGAAAGTLLGGPGLGTVAGAGAGLTKSLLEAITGR